MKLLRAALVLLSVLPAGCSAPPEGESAAGLSTSDATYVGRPVCAECHAMQAELWAGSHHDLAMQPADETTVLGDFGGTTFTYSGVESSFFRRDGKYFARTDGPDGELHDYEIAYTFGVEPLQQYLIEFPKGRLQALNVCWDTRPEEEGGQRWFHLYPDDNVDHGDILHWTGPLQNWNYMCSECHSTNLQKGFDAREDRYETTWSEIDVACEACHGPGSRHVAWARKGVEAGERSAFDNGLVVQFEGPSNWIPLEDRPTSRRSEPRDSHVEAETCARCHSRRAQISDEYRFGRPLADTHRVSLLDERLYHADGQILDEVYVYGSFLQSKMFREGVTCTDCHDPHSTRTRAEGSGLCGTCHRLDVFDTSTHHFHEKGTAGSRCVECHMPSRDYMVVDPRLDHSFRVPRPDLSVEIGTPNACNGCHGDRTAEWAAEAVVRWYGPEWSRKPHYGEALHAGREWLPDAGRRLVAVIDDPQAPAIARATALSLLPAFLEPGMLGSVRRALVDTDPQVRLAALGVLELVDPADRLRLVYPALTDPVRTVRMEAARVLAPVPRHLLNEEQQTILDLGLGEYREAQWFNADRAESHLNLGWLHVQLGQIDEAERSYREALRISPSFAPSAINLADLYRAQGRDTEGEQVLRDALAEDPEGADLHHALGLLLARGEHLEQAVESLERAVELAPGVPRYAYVFGIALHSAGKTGEALEVLKQAHERIPGYGELLMALATISRDAGDLAAATEYARRLAELTPDDPGAQEFYRQMRAASTGS